MKKERVDVLVYNQGLSETREKAKRAVMAGLVYDENNLRMDKPGEKVSVETVLHLKGEGLRYVSRGGLKLEKALKVYEIDMTDKILLDIGSSTGGFTDVALQHGAKMSYALDVGYNQLAWKLRQDERVVVMERTNFRYSKPEDFEQGLPDIASIDVSFISLRLILPVLKQILKSNGEVVALIKPQFEAGKDLVGKNGVIREKSTHRFVLEEMLHFMVSEGYEVTGLDYSPIKGGEGNIEFLAYLKWPGLDQGGSAVREIESWASDIVEQAHSELKVKNK
ncbi:TlyA family RNA methyltransferase [Vagococcus intermedius]|uniref:TlyA family RNA methyltransferase n=1 Tax=Vagococcus intermedius TaxID=2991418 RepID=A0AAF0I9W4_9ENTE|nr:TlyA family RNA methyltransferase [Vagococcus intermedius]WEG73847.1 TlyA family RNA methyltransferase [Vagococcus intermedius]WEG75932.1 TlyA family RNA methyltransferase [Vagococcus intermedius]